VEANGQLQDRPTTRSGRASQPFSFAPGSSQAITPASVISFAAIPEHMRTHCTFKYGSTSLDLAVQGLHSDRGFGRGKSHSPGAQDTTPKVLEPPFRRLRDRKLEHKQQRAGLKKELIVSELKSHLAMSFE